MPRGTVSVEPDRFDLKSAPPDGFVVLRRMPYGKWLHRQELALRLKFEGKQGKEMAGEMAMANKSVTVFEFAECVVDHNLTDEADQPLDLTKSSTLDRLDPQIGNEIGDLIGKLHEVVADEGN